MGGVVDPRPCFGCYTVDVTRVCSSVDRASGSGPEGRGFESLHARMSFDLISVVVDKFLSL